uniref:SFRICE_004075 n=1 Tax=Spodoptera frugiperda TaxID=7108 RepID=A0A2H1V239_SPOFR
MGWIALPALRIKIIRFVQGMVNVMELELGKAMVHAFVKKGIQEYYVMNVLLDSTKPVIVLAKHVTKPAMDAVVMVLQPVKHATQAGNCSPVCAWMWMSAHPLCVNPINIVPM